MDDSELERMIRDSEKNEEELIKNYIEATGNILENVYLYEHEYNIYQEINPYKSVPGALEFVGLKGYLKNLENRGLRIYRDDFDGEFMDDLFPGLSDSERLNLLESRDSRLLGHASSLLHYFHQSRMGMQGKLEKDYLETNALVGLNLLRGFYENPPLSSELYKDIKSFFDIKNNLKDNREFASIMNQLEFRSLKELSQRISEDFRMVEISE